MRLICLFLIMYCAPLVGSTQDLPWFIYTPEIRSLLVEKGVQEIHFITDEVVYYSPQMVHYADHSKPPYRSSSGLNDLRALKNTKTVFLDKDGYAIKMYLGATEITGETKNEDVSQESDQFFDYLHKDHRIEKYQLDYLEEHLPNFKERGSTKFMSFAIDTSGALFFQYGSPDIETMIDQYGYVVPKYAYIYRLLSVQNYTQNQWNSIRQSHYGGDDWRLMNSYLNWHKTDDNVSVLRMDYPHFIETEHYEWPEPFKDSVKILPTKKVRQSKALILNNKRVAQMYEEEQLDKSLFTQFLHKIDRKEKVHFEKNAIIQSDSIIGRHSLYLSAKDSGKKTMQEYVYLSLSNIRNRRSGEYPISWEYLFEIDSYYLVEPVKVHEHFQENNHFLFTRITKYNADGDISSVKVKIYRDNKWQLWIHEKFENGKLANISVEKQFKIFHGQQMDFAGLSLKNQLGLSFYLNEGEFQIDYDEKNQFKALYEVGSDTLFFIRNDTLYENYSFNDFEESYHLRDYSTDMRFTRGN